MDRRGFVVKVFCALSTGLLSGCTYFRSGTIDIAIMSSSSGLHAVELKFIQNNEVVATEVYELEYDDELYEEDVIGGGNYNIRAIVDGDERDHYHYQLEMNGCNEQVLVVELGSDNTVDLDSNIC